MSFVTFGEIMLRLTPNDHGQKINSSNTFNVNYAGSESNVASALGVLNNDISFVSKLPSNQLGDAAVRNLQGFGVKTNFVVRGGSRIGTYFIEIGDSIRPSSVIYDRANSAISTIKEGEFPWEEILRNKKWLFLSGITSVLSEQCAKETINVAKIAKELGVKVAFDMNYRRTLWKSNKDAQLIFNKILGHTDLLFGNAGVIKDVYEMDFEGDCPEEKTINAVLKAKKKFGIEQLAFTIRKHSSASENELSGVLLCNNNLSVAKIIKVNITDRFGTGDAFAAACLHSINKGDADQEIIDFSTAAFALKHTIKGDQHTSSENEIKSIMEGNISGHVLR